MALKQQLANTQDLVEIEEIKESVVLLKDGGLRQVVMVAGLNTALMSESEMDIISSGYQNFLNSLDFPIQIIIHSRKVNIERYLNNLEARKADEPSPLLRNQIGEYQQFISGFVHENAIMEKTFLVVVPLNLINLPSKESVAGITKFIPFFKKQAPEPKQEEQNKELEFKENVSKINQRSNQIIEGLSVIGLEAILLDDQALVELFYNFYNPETIEKELQNIPGKEV